MRISHARRSRSGIVLFFAVTQTIYAPPIGAFPPYKTTDADTADPYNVELRLGLVQTERESGETQYTSPLVRANFGFPNKVELISEFEYLPEEHEFGEGAVGFKWAPVQGTFSFANETLVLLPVRPDDSGTGLESQLIATWHRPGHKIRVHINAGGFHDPRGFETNNGWRASVLTEFMGNDSFRPGIELFTRKTGGQDADTRLGLGVIKRVGQFEIRSAIHAGLTDQAPDVVFNLWLSVKIPLR